MTYFDDWWLDTRGGNWRAYTTEETYEVARESWRAAQAATAAPELLAALRGLVDNSTRADWPTDLIDAAEHALAAAQKNGTSGHRPRAEGNAMTFEEFVLKWTHRDMGYHKRNRTTGLTFAAAAWEAATREAATREAAVTEERDALIASARIKKVNAKWDVARLEFVIKAHESGIADAMLKARAQGQNP